MRVTIDKAGRLVIPKKLRRELHIEPGQALEIQVSSGRLELSVPATSLSLQKGPHGLTAVPDEPLPTLSQEDVRSVLDEVRR